MQPFTKTGSLLIALMITTSISSHAAEPTISLKHYGEFEGEAVTLYTLTNEHGMTAEICDYGGIVVRLLVPDRDGKFEDVVLGYDNFEAYKKDEDRFGSITGRYANRIALGAFAIDGKKYQLATNNGANHLHGGVRGFNKYLWKGTASIYKGEARLKLEYTSPDGQEGFPGNLKMTVIHTLTAENGLKIENHATTDQPTLCNLTHHGYWNIAGPSSNTVLDQDLQFFCDAFTPTDETAIPTGEIRPVAGTPFDFRESHPIGDMIEADNKQLKLGRGYDHNFVINGEPGELRPVARVHDKKSGRVMKMLSSDYGVQFYTGNYFDGSLKGKKGKAYTHRTALCLECQRFPDAPNQPKIGRAHV